MKRKKLPNKAPEPTVGNDRGSALNVRQNMAEDALRVKLERMLVLLRDYAEPEWHAYFTKASVLLAQGKVEACKRKIRGAYGGMCSINDSLYFTGAPKEVADEGFSLRSDLYALSESGGFWASIRDLLR